MKEQTYKLVQELIAKTQELAARNDQVRSLRELIYQEEESWKKYYDEKTDRDLITRGSIGVVELERIFGLDPAPCVQEVLEKRRTKFCDTDKKGED